MVSRLLPSHRDTYFISNNSNHFKFQISIINRERYFKKNKCVELKLPIFPLFVIFHFSPYFTFYDV